jgi:glycosyltransferase involved in cell wall biosynthesis
MQRLGWTTWQGRDYLIKAYGKRSRQLLTDAEVLHFLAYLESQPTMTKLAHIELTDGETVAQSLVSNNEVQASLLDTPTVPTENTSQPALPIYRRSDGGFVVDPWLNEENLQAMAEALAQCESREQLDLLRQCWLPQAMNLACQRLSPEKHAQIQQWEIELNESVVTCDSFLAQSIS